jgi:hypothetical protein
MAKKKKELTPMEKLTAGYEHFVKGKKLNNKGRKLFDKVLKKATKPRSAK